MSRSGKTGGLCHDPDIGIYKWSKRFPNQAALKETDDFSKPKRCCECIWDPFGGRRRATKLREAREKDALFQETFKKKMYEVATTAVFVSGMKNA